MSELRIEKLSVRMKDRVLLNSVTFEVAQGEILAAIGPAGSGKTTLLRAINRMIDLDGGLTVQGQVFINGESVYSDTADVPTIRRKAGLVFSLPTPLPLSISDNLLFGPQLGASDNAVDWTLQMERSLRAAYLWDEVKDRLGMSAMNLSGGQQQRLCLARALMLQPPILLLDEPCSGLDPISTAKIEEALTQLKKDMAIVLVTNNVKQASRVSDNTAFLLMGELVELAPTQELFTNPKKKQTEDYVTGRFG